MENLGALFHESIGGECLKSLGMNTKVVILIKSHVDAKRYLVSINPEYYDKLSNASKGTLEFQGGKMSEDEIKEFENNPLKEVILKMRYWDDMAKVKDLKIPSFSSFKEMIQNTISKL